MNNCRHPSSTSIVVFVLCLQHWQCKLVMVIFNFLLATNYMWIFIEALYLHMLIFVSVFSENSSVRAYIIIGWSKLVSAVYSFALRNISSSPVRSSAYLQLLLPLLLPLAIRYNTKENGLKMFLKNVIWLLAPTRTFFWP